MMNIFEKLGIRTSDNAGSGISGGHGAETAPVSGERDKEVRAAELRERIQKLDENIQSINASIERIVSNIQEGGKVAEQHGNESLMSLNARLGAEAQEEKLKLLEQKGLFEGSRRKLEEELQALGDETR